MTLVELLVAMMATSILLIGIGVVFTGSLKSLVVVTAKGDLTANAQVAMETVSSKLRAGHGVLNAAGVPGATLMVATANSITFRADLPEPASSTAAATQVAPWNPAYASTLSGAALWPSAVRYSWTSTLCGTGSDKRGIIEETARASFVASGVTAGTVSYGAFSSPRCVLRTTSTTGIGFRYFANGVGGASGCALPDAATPTRWPSPSLMPTALTTTTELANVKSVEVSIIAQDPGGRQVSLLNQICLTN